VQHELVFERPPLGRGPEKHFFLTAVDARKPAGLQGYQPAHAPLVLLREETEGDILGHDRKRGRGVEHGAAVTCLGFGGHVEGNFSREEEPRNLWWW